MFGHDIRFAKKAMLRQWQCIASLVLVVELAFLVWPIVALVLWQFTSIFAWPLFVYGIRSMLIFYGIVRVEYVYWMYGSGEFSKYSLVRVWGAFTPYSSVKIWAGLSIFIGVFFGILLFVFNAASFPLYDREDLVFYGVNVGVSFLAVVESYFAPILLYWYAVRTPVKATIHKAKRRKLERSVTV